MKALPWIIIAVIVIAVVYYLYNKSKAQKALAATGILPITCPTGQMPGPDNLTCVPKTTGSIPLPPNTTVAPISTSIIPTAIPGAQVNTASCLNSTHIVKLITEYRSAGFFRRLNIKEEVSGICPEALRYLIKD